MLVAWSHPARDEPSVIINASQYEIAAASVGYSRAQVADAGTIDVLAHRIPLISIAPYESLGGERDVRGLMKTYQLELNGLAGLAKRQNLEPGGTLRRLRNRLQPPCPH